MTLRKSDIGFAMMPFPASTLRTIGIRMTMKISGISHNMPNIGVGKPSLKFRLFTTSMIINGIYEKKADDRR